MSVRKIIPLLGAVGALCVAGGVLLAVGGGGDEAYTTPAPAVPWVVERESPFVWAQGIPADLVSSCPNGGVVEKSCLIEWGSGVLDGSIETFDTVVKAVSLRTLNDPAFYQESCHDVWHALGERAGELYDLRTIYMRSANICHGGIVHGAMSGRARVLGISEYTKEVSGVCDMYKNSPRIWLNDCFHGIGHGYATLLNWPEVFDGCKMFSQGDEEFDWCAAGAMETVYNRIVEGDTALLSSIGDPTSACTRFQRENDACWRYIVFVMLRGEGTSLEQVSSVCAKQDDLNRTHCSFAVGGVAASMWEFNAELTVCDEMVGEFHISCWKGAARSVTRGSEQTYLEPPPRAEGLGTEMRLTLCAVVPAEITTWCHQMETAELGDEFDQADQARLARDWSSAQGLPAAW